MKCNNCTAEPVTVGEVRSCSLCQRNGTAGAVHAKFQNHDSVEDLVADANPGAFPFFNPDPDPADEGENEAVLAKTTKKKKSKTAT